MDKLNLEDLDVEALEQRLEMSLTLHPFDAWCGQHNDKQPAAR